MRDKPYKPQPTLSTAIPWPGERGASKHHKSKPGHDKIHKGFIGFRVGLFSGKRSDPQKGR